MKLNIKAVLWTASTAVRLSGCAARSFPNQFVDDNFYVGGVAQPKGPFSIGRSYSFRFVEKWRISHAWIEGTGARPCMYPSNVFQRTPGYPSLANEPNAPMFEKDGKVYTGTSFESMPGRIVFGERSYEFFGEGRSIDRTFEGKYTPFCAQFFSTSRNGMSLSIIKPDPEKGTDGWIANCTPKTINGRTWLVKNVPPKDLSETGLIQPIEYWTLKIPSTPYWMHLTFSASLDYSVRRHGAEHDALLDLFHQVIESVKLEPISPIDPALMPPFVLLQPQQPQRKFPQ